MKFDIVLIDDHSLVLEGLKTLLRDIAGVNSVCTVTNGTELLSLIKSRIFHIYITDLELPDIDGFELMHSIKENNPQAKVIVCTSRRVRGAFDPEARCGYRNPTLSSILATQMPCRSCRSGAYAARRELCGVAISSTTPIENVRETKMLRKGEQRSPTEICHVYDINVRCYVKAAGAQCAPLCSQQNF